MEFRSVFSVIVIDYIFKNVSLNSSDSVFSGKTFFTKRTIIAIVFGTSIFYRNSICSPVQSMDT